MSGKQVAGAGLVAVGLTVIFWLPLWQGAGLIGGDLYSYFFPQKQYFADHWQQGELPLWNNRTGHGYPVVAESQTGVLYPPDLVLYRWLDINTAYNINQLLHYVLTFLFTWMYARKIGQSFLASLLAGLVYTYGWFPSRLCLEWAIIGGMYLPLGLFWVESWLQSGRKKFLLFLSLTLGLQLLAGHFHLAFIHLLVLTAYGPARLFWARDSLAPEFLNRQQAGLSWLGLSLLAGFLLASIQIFPTWELKQQSQREGVTREFDPAEGHIPPVYWSQVAASWWFWYAPDIDTDKAIKQLDFATCPGDTNKVEAHLYFGLLPLVFAAGLLATQITTANRVSRSYSLWLLLGFLGLIYTSGWLLPVTRHLPGFGFFRGPGRYGIVTTLAVALWAGRAWDQWTARTRTVSQVVLFILLASLTAGDLWWVSRLVNYTTMLPKPPLNQLADSPLRERFSRETVPPRVHAPGPNLPNLLGISQDSVYLGLGPAEYFDPTLTFPDQDKKSTTLSLEQLDWLSQAGVNYVLHFEPLIPVPEEVELTWQGPDPFLNQAWGRHPRESFYLYRLTNAPGRLRWVGSSEAGSVEITDYSANRVLVRTDAPAGTLVLTDLDYPGWQVTVDGEPAESLKIEEMYRGVSLSDGPHVVEWTYQSTSFRWGMGISLVTLLVLLTVTMLNRRKVVAGRHASGKF